MFLFKKKINIDEFTIGAIQISFSSYISNFSAFASLADEYHVLGEKDREELEYLGYSLIIANLIYDFTTHFTAKQNIEITSGRIGFICTKYLIQLKKFDEKEMRKVMNQSFRLYEKASDDEKDFKYRLCTVFSELFTGKHKPNNELDNGRHFAAFKFANSLVKADIVEILSKEYSILWD